MYKLAKANPDYSFTVSAEPGLKCFYVVVRRMGFMSSYMIREDDMESSDWFMEPTLERIKDKVDKFLKSYRLAREIVARAGLAIEFDFVKGQSTTITISNSDRQITFELNSWQYDEDWLETQLPLAIAKLE